MSKIVVLGGAGFIGSHIVEELFNRGDEVKIIDNFVEGTLNNLEFVPEIPKPHMKSIYIINGDILDYDLLVKEFKGFDYVIHHAALRSVPKSVEKPEEYNHVNIVGTFNVLKAAHECGVKRVIFASSSSIYGSTGAFPTKEITMPHPESPYAITKLVGELYCDYFYKQFGLETVSLRYFNVSGPRQDPTCQYAAVIPIFITKMANGESPIIYGNGKQMRDIVYVKDVVKVNLAMLTARGVSGKVFNVGSGETYSVNDYTEKIKTLMHSKIKPKYEDKRAGDVFKTHANIDKIKNVINFEPSPIEKWLKETIRWFTNGSNK